MARGEGGAVEVRETEAEAEAEPRAEGGRGAVGMEWEARRLFVQERPAGGGGSISRCVAGR